MNEVLLARIVKIREGVQIKHLPQGKVVLSFKTSQAFGVNGTGAEILSRLSEPILLRDLAVEIASHYGAAVTEVAAYTIQFLEECARLGLVEIDAGTPAPESK